MTNEQTDITITAEGNAAKGRILGKIAGLADEAELTWVGSGDVDGEGVIIADHTFVPPSFRGRGVAAMLVEALIAQARAQDWKIVPQCSYVVASFARHPEWGDLKG